IPVATCSAITAGPLPSMTQATEGDGLVGSCGAANTAPSGLSAPVTRSAENGMAMGAPRVKGPEAGAGTVGGGAPPAAVVVDVWRGEVGVGDPPELQAANTTDAVSTASPATNPNCSR